MLNIKKEQENDVLKVVLEGRLDTTTAPQLESELKEVLPAAKELIFDMADLEYISSAGLRVPLSAQKVMSRQGSMKVIHVREEVNEIFEVTGFCDILTIEP